MTERILVTDGDERAALAVVRSLGRAGHECTVVSARRRSLAGASRWAAREECLPDPLHAPSEFANSLARLSGQVAADVVIPIADPSLLAVLEQVERFAPASVPFPDLATVRKASDKGLVLALAEGHGIGIPRQVAAGSLTEALKRAGLDVGYPLVVKPARSVAGAPGTRVKVGVRQALDPSGLHEAVATLPEGAYPVLLQERIVGPGVGIFLLLWDGEVRALFAHRRLREKPPSGGVSTYRESIPADPGLVHQSRGLLEDLGWRGVAMVEYKLDASTGRPYLMEINGRFWGSLQLAIDAGVDFPRLLVDLARGRDPGPVPGWRSGIRSRWEWGDADHLLARLLRSRRTLALPPDAPGLGRVLRDVLRPWRPGEHWEVLRPGDPRPFLRETLDWFRRSS